MVEKYQKLNPSDARIFIDYKNKKKPVRFEYPAKQSPFKIVFLSLMGIWFQINLFFIIPNVIILFMAFSIASSPPTECVVHQAVSLKDSILPTIAAIFHAFFLPLVSTLIIIKNEKLLSYMPKINVWGQYLFDRSFKYKKVTKVDSKTFEIPVFDNVFLDYKATKDFSKYLEKVSIVEHDFKECTISKLTGKIKKSKKRQVDLWKAKFTFSKIPKKGYLEIKYR